MVMTSYLLMVELYKLISFSWQLATGDVKLANCLFSKLFDFVGRKVTLKY